MRHEYSTKRRKGKISMAEERKHTTLSGYGLKRVYTEEDKKGEDLKAQLGDPGP